MRVGNRLRGEPVGSCQGDGRVTARDRQQSGLATTCEIAVADALPRADGGNRSGRIDEIRGDRWKDRFRRIPKDDLDPADDDGAEFRAEAVDTIDAAIRA